LEGGTLEISNASESAFVDDACADAADALEADEGEKLLCDTVFDAVV
jgi:hypothetical protein